MEDSSMDMDSTPVMDTLIQMSDGTFERSDLDPTTFMLVRIAALVAMDAPPLSYLTNLTLGDELGVSAEEVQGVLVAIAPVVGGPRIVSSVGNIARALGIEIAISGDDDGNQMPDDMD
jgi:4-carboxymuconolactone decarboxylase